jgi:hypothetical protein
VIHSTLYYNSAKICKVARIKDFIIFTSLLSKKNWLYAKETSSLLLSALHVEIAKLCLHGVICQYNIDVSWLQQI